MSSSKGTALITGASAGIGATYADRLARRGYDLILVARNAGRLSSLAAALRETGVAAETIPADLTDKADLARVEQRLASDRAITLLVNNAGVAALGGAVGQDVERIDTMIQLNVVAVTRLAAAAATAFTARGKGAIVNIGSVLGLLPELRPSVYHATKSFVLTFSQALHLEVKDRGIQIQAVLPGATRTEIWEKAGVDVSTLDPNMVMEVGEMVDAALAGFDQGELVTIPSLPSAADWDAFNTARLALAPNLSRNHAAARYKASAVRAA